MKKKSLDDNRFMLSHVQVVTYIMVKTLIIPQGYEVVTK